MSLSDSRPWPFPWLWFPSGRWGLYLSPPCRVSQVPRLIYPCVLSPSTPEGPTGACSLLPRRLQASSTPADWPPSRRNEADSGSLALRLAGLLPRFPPDELLHPAPVPLHVRTSNLHGELLSVHKISQA